MMTNGQVVGYRRVSSSSQSLARQELPEVYQPNGAIYIVNLEAFKEYKSFFTDKTIQYKMLVDKSIDVDTLENIKQIENQLKYNPLC